MKLKKKYLDAATEITMVTAFMTLEGRLDRLYDIINKELDLGGIMDTTYTMSWFACEFIDLHKDTDWEDVFSDDTENLSDVFLHRSDKYKKYGKYVTCWDEAIEDYAEWRIDNFNSDEFAKINFNREAKNPLLKTK